MIDFNDTTEGTSNPENQVGANKDSIPSSPKMNKPGVQYNDYLKKSWLSPIDRRNTEADQRASKKPKKGNILKFHHIR